MGDHTGIEWTDATWNPIRGCSRVSEGCRHCYAERVAARFSGPGLPYEGLAVMRNGEPRWTGKVQLIEEHLEDPLHWTKPRRIFVNSMSDLFHEELTLDMIAHVFAVMASAPHHVFQVLTKRPARMREVLADELPQHVGEYWPGTSALSLAFEEPGARWPLPNVWLGVSAENQSTADDRIPQLLLTPAAIRFVSAEPLLSEVDLRAWLHPGGLDWVIVGGESGPRARPMHPGWASFIASQCAHAGIAFFFKQWGEWEPVRDLYRDGSEHLDGGRGDTFALEHDGTFHGPGAPTIQPRPGAWLMERVGKARAGRRLFGGLFESFPDAGRGSHAH